MWIWGGSRNIGIREPGRRSRGGRAGLGSRFDGRASREMVGSSLPLFQSIILLKERVYNKRKRLRHEEIRKHYEKGQFRGYRCVLYAGLPQSMLI